METRSHTRAGQIQAPPEGVLEDLVSRSPTDLDEDWGLETLLSDREVPAVGEGRPEVSATASVPGDNPLGRKWVPAGEPVVESQDVAVPRIVSTKRRTSDSTLVSTSIVHSEIPTQYN